MAARDPARGRDARADFEGDLAVPVAADQRCRGTMSLFPPDGCPLLRRLRRTVWITKPLRQWLEHQTPSMSSMHSEEPRRIKIIELVLIGQRRRRQERPASSQGAVVWRVLIPAHSSSSSSFATVGLLGWGIGPRHECSLGLGIDRQHRALHHRVRGRPLRRTRHEIHPVLTSGPLDPINPRTAGLAAAEASLGRSYVTAQMPATYAASVSKSSLIARRRRTVDL